MRKSILFALFMLLLASLVLATSCDTSGSSSTIPPKSEISLKTSPEVGRYQVQSVRVTHMGASEIYKTIVLDTIKGTVKVVESGGKNQYGIPFADMKAQP